MAPHSKTGASNKEDIIYRAMASCLKVGAVPNLEAYAHAPSVAIPVDDVASSIVDFASSGEEILLKPVLQFTPTNSGASWFSILLCDCYY